MIAEKIEPGQAVGLNDCSNLRSRLCANIASQTPVVIDMSAIDRMTTPLLQIILAAKKTYSDNRCGFSVENISDSVRVSLEAAGIDSEFNCIS